MPEGHSQPIDVFAFGLGVWSIVLETVVLSYEVYSGSTQPGSWVYQVHNCVYPDVVSS